MSILKVKNGTNWDEIPSIKGKSAYQYAVDGGYQGTEQEFAQKLADEYVKPTDYATSSDAGVVKVDSTNGIGIESGHKLYVEYAPSNLIKSGTGNYRPITPPRQHEATFFGLAKAAGDSTQSASSNAVGTYTDDAKSAIKTMLGVAVDDVQVNGSSILNNGVANVPVASANNFGTVKMGGTAYGIHLKSSGIIYTEQATLANIKDGTQGYKAIVPERQHESVFYGLAKAAGADMASSDNAVGTYTDAAKIAIQKMLGIYEAPWELICQDEFTNATAGTYEISVDGDGIGFELTDIQFVLVTPVQDTQAGLGSYGRVYFYYGAGVQEYDTAYFGSYTQAAGSAAQSSTAIIEQRDGMRTLMYGTHTTGGGDINPKYHSSNIPGSYVDGFLVGTEKVYTKIIIGEVVGTAKYALYGKRKWH